MRRWSGWAVGTNLFVRIQLHETSVVNNSDSENCYFPHFLSKYLVNHASAAFLTIVFKNDSRNFLPL